MARNSFEAEIPLEAVGEFPPEWERSTLGRACSLVTDGTHDSPKESQQGFPLVTGKCITGGRVRLDEAYLISEQDHLEVTARSKPEWGDILFANIGNSIGELAQVETRAEFSIKNVALFKPSNKIDSLFLKYYLLSPAVQGYIKATTLGSAQPFIGLATLRAFPVPLPPMKEQLAISRALGVLEKKIELNRLMNETLGVIACALFKSWFVDFDPLIARTEKFQDSELGNIPLGSRVAQLGDIALVIDCLHSKKPGRQQDGKPLLQLWNIRDDGLLDTTDTYFISEQDYRLWISRMEARRGDCVITNVGRVAAVAQIPPNCKAALGRNMTGVRCRDEYPYPTFLLQLLMSASMKEEISSKTDSGTILDSLNVRSIPCLRFVLPPHETLQHFEEMCRPLRAKMEANLEESNNLTELRNAVLPKLMSGEIRLQYPNRIAGSAI